MCVLCGHGPKKGTLGKIREWYLNVCLGLYTKIIQLQDEIAINKNESKVNIDKLKLLIFQNVMKLF